MSLRFACRLFVALTIGGVLVGCAASAPSSPPPPDAFAPSDSVRLTQDASLSTLDSLRIVNVTLRDDNRRLRDSVQLYDDVESGRYRRELRALRDQMTRLSFELSRLRDGGQTVATLPTDALFEPASARLHANGRERLQQAAAQLRHTYPDRTVWVAGHSDNTPIGPDLQDRFPSNWELSAARASAVVRALIDLSGLSPNQFVALGYGATHPRAGNETERGRRRNRRVRIAVLPIPRDYSRPFETSW